MNQPRFLIVSIVGTLFLLNFSPSPFGSGQEENKRKQTSFVQEIQTEDNQELQQETDLASNLRLDLLDPSILAKVANFLPQENFENLGYVNKSCFGALSSHSNLELSLEKRNLTEDDFLSRFKEIGFYNTVQCLNLSCSSFDPKCLSHLPKTIKSLKLKFINLEHFSQYGFLNEWDMLNAIVRTLGGDALPKIKFLDISWNGFRDNEIRLIVESLKSLTHLVISKTYMSGKSVHTITENLKSLIRLDLSDNRMRDEEIRLIAENLKSLTYLDISRTQVTDDGVCSMTENLKSLKHLNIAHTKIEDEAILLIAKNLKGLKYLSIYGNQVGSEAVLQLVQLTHLVFLLAPSEIEEEIAQELREKLPLCQTRFLPFNTR